MKIENNKVFIQIGTNNGNDYFNRMVRENNPSMVILVEPNKSLNNQIYKNYLNINNVFLENVAITDKNIGDVKLFLPKDIENGKHSVNGIHYGDAGFSLLPMDDWGDDFNILETASMTFNELCDKYNIKDVHLLQIDTEGYDSEIIKSIDFNKINIDMIIYEQWNFDETCFTRHGIDYKKYGKNGMEYVSNLLQSFGYILTDLQHDILATKNKFN